MNQVQHKTNGGVLPMESRPQVPDGNARDDRCHNRRGQDERNRPLPACTGRDRCGCGRQRHGRCSLGFFHLNRNIGRIAYPNELDRGYICNSSFFGWIEQGSGFSSILMNVAKEFGGGTSKLLRVRDGEVISSRVVDLPGPTNDLGVIAPREMLMDPW